MQPSAKPNRDLLIEQGAVVATLRDELREEVIWRHQQACEERCLRNELREALSELTLATTILLQHTGRDVDARHREHLLSQTRPLVSEELYDGLQEVHMSLGRPPITLENTAHETVSLFKKAKHTDATANDLPTQTLPLMEQTVQARDRPLPTYATIEESLQAAHSVWLDHLATADQQQPQQHESDSSNSTAPLSPQHTIRNGVTATLPPAAARTDDGRDLFWL